MKKDKLPRFMVCSNPLVDEEDYLFVLGRKDEDSPVSCIVRISDMECVSGHFPTGLHLRATDWLRAYYSNKNK